MKTISIVIPAYNEGAFIGELLKRIFQVPTEAAGFEKQVIVVDDGSNDDTSSIAAAFPGVTVLRQNNLGKGAAVQRGIREARGTHVLVQDADLEYDPADYTRLLRQVSLTPTAAIYGSRIMGEINRSGYLRLTPGKHPRQNVGAWLAGIILSITTFIFYRKWISDTLTGYKIYPTETMRQIRVTTSGFESDHEITCKLVNRNVPIIEVPISYAPRSSMEGKKIRARDGVIAVWTLIKFRFE